MFRLRDTDTTDMRRHSASWHKRPHISNAGGSMPWAQVEQGKLGLDDFIRAQLNGLSTAEVENG